MNKRVINFLLETGVIKSYDVEIYEYGFDLLLKKMVHLLMILLIGVIADEFWSVLFFLLAYASIREYAGGYHAATQMGCYCCTVIVTVCAIGLVHIFQYLSARWIWTLLLFCGTIIWILSPQQTPNRPLVVTEKRIYRNIVHKYLIVCVLIIILCFRFRVFVLSITCAWIIQTVMLILACTEKRLSCNKRRIL